MSFAWQLQDQGEADVRRVGELLALKAAAGDLIALSGDLGAGKTLLARAFIRAWLGEPEAEVPSPTFPIVQTYHAPRGAVAHFDLYRLAGEDDLREVGFDDALKTAVVLVEWPERAPAALSPDRLDITLLPGPADDRRCLSLVGHGRFAARLERLALLHRFLEAHLPGRAPAARIVYLQGDASARAYARVTAGGRSYVLMDAPRMPDGPPVANGLPYSRIAHLAEDVRPFVAIGRALEAASLSVPHIFAADLERGFLLLEDLGDMTFGRALAAGVQQRTLWSAAVDVLIRLRQSPLPEALPLPDATSYRLPRFDRAALEIEIGLILDWYWPEVKAGDPPAAIREEFLALWRPLLDRLMAEPPGLFLRDYHSPNLFWLPERPAGRQVGVIDFQDALAEPYALDLVSLLQDARIDVPRGLEEELKAHYLAEVGKREPAFDAASFLATYAIFGAQRNTRLIGLWVRLLRRDGKPGYLMHMPRTWAYLERNLAHPALAGLRSWYERHFPDEVRQRPIVP